MKYGSVDRVEGTIAIIVFDDNSVLEHESNILKEGDRVVLKNNQIRKICNKRRKKEMILLQNMLFNNQNK